MLNCIENKISVVSIVPVLKTPLLPHFLIHAHVPPSLPFSPLWFHMNISRNRALQGVCHPIHPAVHCSAVSPEISSQDFLFLCNSYLLLGRKRGVYALLRLKAARLGERRDTTSVSQSLLLLGMSRESWVTTSTVQILSVTSGSEPEVALHNKYSS